MMDLPVRILWREWETQGPQGAIDADEEVEFP
jgi:hypothetical protein